MRTLKPSIPVLKPKRPPLLSECANAQRRLSRSIANRQKQRVWLKQQGRCNVCGCVLPLTDCELDHVTPLVAGGALTDWNTQVLCVECHKTKTAAEITARANRSDVWTSER